MNLQQSHGCSQSETNQNSNDILRMHRWRVVLVASALLSLAMCVIAQDDAQLQLLLRPDLRGMIASSSLHSTIDKSALQTILLGAQQQQPESQYLLAMMRLYGHGVEKDVRAAVALLKQAASQAHMDAEFALAVLHSTGNVDGGVPQSDRMSATWLSGSANRGHVDAKWMLAMCVLRACLTHCLVMSMLTNAVLLCVRLDC